MNVRWCWPIIFWDVSAKQSIWVDRILSRIPDSRKLQEKSPSAIGMQKSMKQSSPTFPVFPTLPLAENHGKANGTIDAEDFLLRPV